MSTETTGNTTTATRDPRFILGPNTTEQLSITTLDQIEIIRPWQRGGSETYICEFTLTNRNINRQHLLAKACVKFCAAEAMQEWLERRETLQSAGIITPQIFYQPDKATIIEEFIDFSVAQALQRATREKQEMLTTALNNTKTILTQLGFDQTGLHDARSHGDDIVLIDYGEDLGGRKTN